MKLIGNFLFCAGVHLLIFTFVNHTSGQSCEYIWLLFHKKKFRTILSRTFRLCVSVISWQDYLRNVAQKFISILQEREITGAGMPLNSFDATMKYVQNSISL